MQTANENKIFKARTSDAYTLRNLIDLLQNNLKTACLEIDSNDIKMSMQDANNSILISFVLNGSSFLSYKVDDVIYPGLNLKHLHKILKTIKKKDIIELFIDKSNPKELGSCVTTKEGNRTVVSYIQIQDTQNLEISVPTDYDNSKTIQSTDFQKMIKDMVNIGNTNSITIQSGKSHVIFSCNEGDIIKRRVEFGEDNGPNQQTDFIDSFDVGYISKILKISSLGSTITIHTKKDLPILLTSNVGSLGKINIYIKSKSQMENDKKMNNE
jgi:proliferating cell nuclear antigen PCNA